MNKDTITLNFKNLDSKNHTPFPKREVHYVSTLGQIDYYCHFRSFRPQFKEKQPLVRYIYFLACQEPHSIKYQDFLKKRIEIMND